MPSKGLKLHFKFHDENKMNRSRLFKCNFCPHTFDCEVHLRRHMNIHENIMKYCSFCKYRTVQFYHLEDHLNNHFNIKKYKCENCEKAFHHPQDKLLHFKQYHEKEGKYKCNKCQFSTDWKPSLTRHNRNCLNK